jgi:uncharacterized protein involved in exopolysaccharide biosynthesis
MRTQEVEVEEKTIRPWLAEMKDREPLTFATVFLLLQRAWRSILIGVAVGCAAATVVAFAVPVTFTATASFVPPGANSESSAAALMGQLASFAGGAGLLEGKGKGDLYVAILKSHTIARQMVERFHLLDVYKVKKESVAEKKLASRSLFRVDSKDPVVTIEVTDRSAQRAQALAAGYLQALQETSAGLALTESSQRRLFYEQRLAQEKDQLANAEVALKQNEEKTGLVAPAGQTASNIQALAQVQAQITSGEAELASLLQGETDQNPDVARLRSEIASLRGKAAALESGSSGGFGRPSTAQVPELELEYIRRSRDVKYHEALFEIIAKQYEAARLDEAKDAPLQVLDRPVVPDTKSGPPRALIMLTGLVLGLVGGSSWVLLRAARID